jgi:hypothetical protein
VGACITGLLLEEYKTEPSMKQEGALTGYALILRQNSLGCVGFSARDRKRPLLSGQVRYINEKNA